MQEWTQEQVLEWIGLIGLPVESTKAVQRALATDDTDGEDLVAYQESGSAKLLQKSLKRAGVDDAATVAKHTMALHEAAQAAAPAKDKLMAAQAILDTARAELRRNTVALRSHVVHLVSIGQDKSS